MTISICAMRAFDAASRPMHFVLCGAFLLTGCESSDGFPPSAKVSGQITFQGQPVAEGVVNFISPKTGNASSGTLNAEGKYEIAEGIPPGDYQVSVTPPRVTRPPMPGEPAPEAKPYTNIPEKVRTETTSGLRTAVKPGPNAEVNFKLD
jgi:hypothetical protein